VKILQLIDSLAIGGAERMAVNMANAFSDKNITNFLVCSRSTGPLKKFLPIDTEYFELNKSSSFDVIAFYKLIRVIKEYRPEIIHAHSSSIYWGIAAKFFCPSIKLIWHDHDGLSENLQDSDRKILKKLSLFINGIVAVNEILEKWSSRNMMTQKVVFIRNFPYLKNLKTLKKEGNIILHLANLRPQKDHFTLIEAIRILREFTTIPFEVWCAGADNNDSYSKNIKNLVIKYELEGVVKFLGSSNDSITLLQQASIGVLSSQSEGLPVSLLEYGLAGLPVVVTNVGQCAEVLGELGEESVIPRNNPEQLAEALEWHFQNRTESMIKGKMFQAKVQRDYGSSSFLDNYINFISRI